MNKKKRNKLEKKKRTWSWGTGAITGESSEAMVASGSIKSYCFGGWLLSSSATCHTCFQSSFLQPGKKRTKCVIFRISEGKWVI